MDGGNAGRQHPGIVVDRCVKGDSERPDKRNAGGRVFYIPSIHGQNVNPADLPISPGEKSVADQCVSTPSPDLGTVVMCSNEGNGSPRVIGGSTFDGATADSSSGTPGNMNLLQVIMSLINTPENTRNQPPKFKDTTRGKTKVREIEEKGPHIANLYNGIPPHGAMSTIAGVRIPQMKNIATAIQSFDSILTGDMAAKLPGIAMSLGGILSSVLSNPQTKQAISQNKTPEMLNAMTSIAALSQEGEISPSGGSTGGLRVQPEVFSNNCVTLLSQCENIDDLLSCIEELHSNTSLHGFGEEDLILTLDITGSGDFINGETVYQDISNTSIAIGNVIAWNKNQKILDLSIQNRDLFDPSDFIYNLSETDPAYYTIKDHLYFITSEVTHTQSSTTPFGSSSTSMDSIGNVRQSPSDSAAKAIGAFTSLLSGAASSMSAVEGKNLFGSSSGTIMNMLQRLPPEAMAQGISVLTAGNLGEPDQIKDLRKVLSGGGNPLTKLLGM